MYMSLSTEPQVVTPEQVYDLAPGRHVPDGVRRLIVAILADAIDTYTLYAQEKSPAKRRLHLQARRWFASNDKTWVFSFLRISEALGIEPSSLRRALRSSSGPRRARAARRGPRGPQPRRHRHAEAGQGRHAAARGARGQTRPREVAAYGAVQTPAALTP